MAAVAVPPVAIMGSRRRAMCGAGEEAEEEEEEEVDAGAFLEGEGRLL